MVRGSKAATLRSDIPLVVYEGSVRREKDTLTKTKHNKMLDSKV